MVLTRHTRMAPASIQRQRQHRFYPAHRMHEASTHPTETIVGNTVVYDFNAALKQSLYTVIEVPRDWIPSTDMFLYPVFFSDQNVLGNMRWGAEILAAVEGVSIAAVPFNIEQTIPCNGTAIQVPNQEYWLRIARTWIWGSTYIRQDNYTILPAFMVEFFRDGASALDTHAGLGRLLGVMHVYDAFI